jgi:hypothetical protein
MDILLKFAIHAKNLSERPGVAPSERRKVQEAIFKFEPEQNAATMGTETDQIAFELSVLANSTSWSSWSVWFSFCLRCIIKYSDRP